MVKCMTCNIEFHCARPNCSTNFDSKLKCTCPFHYMENRNDYYNLFEWYKRGCWASFKKEIEVLMVAHEL